MRLPTVADIMAMPDYGTGEVLIYHHVLLGDIEVMVTGVKYDDFHEPNGRKRDPENNWYVWFEFEFQGKVRKMCARASRLKRTVDR
jgi:hypothetical protein